MVGCLLEVFELEPVGRKGMDARSGVWGESREKRKGPEGNTLRGLGVTAMVAGENLAPEAGLEPATHRLTAGCSTIELLWNHLTRVLLQ